MLLGLARQLSGVSAPKVNPPGGATSHQEREELRDQERIQREAAEIERRGRQEGQAAYRGDYSETPKPATDPETGSIYSYNARPSSIAGESMPPSPTQTATQYSTNAEMTDAELTLANTNLMARIAPFMTNPSVALPVTTFFYNETQSSSRTVMTNDAGHFILRAPLDFIPTHVRVLANEDLSTIQEVKITEPHGVSLISDVDDTVKRSNISGGAKEIFRNTFVRDLGDLTVDGVKEWYHEMHHLGVSIHYCSNSPWQLFPVLASFFKLVGLPPGSLHLKQYSGMLQGIFEPVAERKKSTLDRLLKDFPERRFLLVGDSGEADLEVYTDLALQNPGRVLAIFIRDVTTPEKTEFFENSFDTVRRKTSNLTLNGGFTHSSARNPLPPRPEKASTMPITRSSTGLVMGNLIDLSEDSKPNHVKAKPNPGGSAIDLLSGRKAPPPRPSKPQALRSSPSLVEVSGIIGQARDRRDTPPPPLPTRKPVGSGLHPLSQIQNSSGQSLWSQFPKSGREPPPPPPPRRRGTGTPSSRNSDVDFDPLPSSTFPQTQTFQTSSLSRTTTRSASPTDSQPVNKKLELWRRRLARAHEQLEGSGVQLYTWRRGQDVVEEAVGIVRRENEAVVRRGVDRAELHQQRWRE